MRRVVADYLESRIERDAVLVMGTPLAADALDFLHRGLVWTVDYRDGRLLADIGAWHAAATGDLDLLRRYLDGGGERYTPLLQRSLRGERLTEEERATLGPYDRGLALLSDRAHGLPIGRAEALATAALLSDEDGTDLVAQIDQPIGGYRKPLTDDPIEPVTSYDYLTPYDYVRSGDHAGCVAQLDLRLAHALAELATGESPAHHVWRQIAMMTRFLTDDDALAMRRLEHLRIGDLRDEWLAAFGPLGAARIQREKDDVLAVIERAFDGVPFPGPKCRSLFQAEAADNRSGCGQSNDHKGRWQDLPREHILACQYAISHLDSVSLVYYLPAIMCFAVREFDAPRDDHGARWIFESLEYTFYFEFRDRKHVAYLRKAFARFTSAQFAAVVRFLDYYPSRPEDRARWRAVAERGEWPAP